MKKEITYFVNCNGLYFSFDCAKRSSKNRARLCFERNNISLCQLDLEVSKLVFTFKNIPTNAYYFEIVPVGGASNGGWL